MGEYRRINLNEEFRYMKIHIFERALHQYRRGHGFKSRTGLNFFQVLFTTTSFSSVLSCEDLLISNLNDFVCIDEVQTKTEKVG